MYYYPLYRNCEIQIIMNPEWVKIQLEDETECLIWFNIESNTEEFKYCCYLTDLTNIFKEEGDLHSFMTRFSSLNKDTEVEDEDQRGLVNYLKLSLKDCKKIGKRVNDIIELKLVWEWEGCDLKFIFKLSQGTSELFSEIVTRKLFLCLLKQQQDKDSLLEVIKKKDLEIEDYENCGARLSRSSLKTGKLKVEDNIKDFIVGPAPKIMDYLADTKFKELLKSSVVPVQSHDKDLNVTNNADIKTDTKDKKRKYVKPNLAQLANSNKVNAKKKQRLDKF